MIKMNSDVRRLLQKSWLWLIIVVASASAWLLAFYWASQTPSKLSFEIWVGSAEKIVDDGLRTQLNSICIDGGMKEFSVNTYDPDDYFYPQAFALKSRSVEIFILSKDEATSIAETKMFATLNGDYGDKNTLEYDGNVIGVEFKDGYFALINGASRKSSELLRAVFNAIVNYEVIQ